MKKLFISAILFTLLTGTSFGWSVNLFWDSNVEPDVTSYNVYRATATGAYGAPIDSVPANPFPSYSDQGHLTGTGPFFYVVTAVNNAGLESAFSNEVSASEPTATPPNAPTINITITVSP